MASSITITGDKKLAANLAKLTSGEADKIFESALKFRAQKILTTSQQTLNSNGNRATGELFRSGIVNVEDLQAEIEYKTEHAFYVEFGRKAGRMPPVSYIEQWVKKKGIATVASKGANRVLSNAIKSAAFAIAKHIAENGTKAYPYLYPAFNSNKGKLTADIKAYYEKYLSEIKT